MNEVTRIHLGRQPFNISVEAHHALKAYLAEIRAEVQDDDVVNEVELRMAELLYERGISGEKVMLMDDVDYLKQQLGNPADFSDDNEPHAVPAATEQAPKRLFRDTDGAMLGGVAAGLAHYFGIDVVLIRIAFVLLTLGWGVGPLLYIVLWLVVAPAITSSEKLQMQGKTVTVDALKESISKADFPGAARRAHKSLLPIINTVLGIAVKIIGLGFIVGGLAIIFGMVAIKTYMWLHHGQLFQENIFPVGDREQLLTDLGAALAAILGIFSVLLGVAMFKHKWPIRGWVTAALAGIFAVVLVAAAVLSVDVGARVQTRYETILHTTAVSNIPAFDNVTTTGGVDIQYVSAPNYSVSLRYVGNPDISKIKIGVTNHTLHIDSTAFDGSRHCTMLCLFPEYNMVVQISAPNVQNFVTPPETEKFFPPLPPSYPQLN